MRAGSRRQWFSPPWSTCSRSRFRWGGIGAPDRDSLLGLLGNPLVALVLLVVCVLSLFHWAQRFRYTLFDGLRLKAHQRLINTVVYALAVLGSIAALVVLGQAVAARPG